MFYLSNADSFPYSCTSSQDPGLAEDLSLKVLLAVVLSAVKPYREHSRDTAHSDSSISLPV